MSPEEYATVELLKEERELYMLKNRDMTSSEEWDAWNDLDTKSDDDLIKEYLVKT